MKKMMMLAALLTWLPAAQSAGDPIPDSIGVYFDPAGTSHAADVGLFTPFHAYLIVTNPTAPIDAFEFLVVRSNAASFVLSTNLGEGAVDSDAAADGYRVTRTTPYPVVGGVVVLVDWQWMLQSPCLLVYLGPGTDPLLPGGLPVLGHAGAYRLAAIVSGSPQAAVALTDPSICWCADEPTSFGALKSLYR